MLVAMVENVVLGISWIFRRQDIGRYYILSHTQLQTSAVHA
jgi:hypothetical protein